MPLSSSKVWAELKSNGWLVAAALFVLLIFRDVVKGWVTKAFHAAGEAAYRRLAGSRLLRRRAVRRYTESVGAYYAEASVPFMDEKLAMRDVYVPLTALPLGEANGERTVVTGAPGAGKSMLLRHAMHAWATGQAAVSTVPVLCELHRHNGNDRSLEDHIEQQLALHDFPGAAGFIDRSLQLGQLTVLLDGFDEVSTAERGRVGQLIKDFAIRYPKTRIVVTCRTAIYKPQLIPEMTQRLQISELDDRMILNFLGRWPGINEPERVQQLMEALRDNPRVMQLARNPLLLTMIAYLYANAGDRRQLPHSRAAFYADATSLLLRQLKDSNNQFDGGTKTEVLQKIALACMDADTGADRMTLPHRAVVDLIAETLPTLNEPSQFALPILDEIVERSGLLLRIDGGERYQFAHLTLQEYLAARELTGDPKALLKRFETDPSRWRESLKLWCGITAKDCTDVVESAFKLEPLVGLECLADARVVDADLADRIVEEMLTELDVAEPGPSLVAAFGVVAADPRPRGSAVYDRLVSQAGFGRRGAIQALAATNLPKASKLLAQLAARQGEARLALIRMGDLSVPALAGFVEAGHQWAIDCLAAIATPAATEILVKQLWAGPTSMLASRAAWRLAALTRQPDVALTLRTAAPPAVRLGGYDWCWEPFTQPGQGTMPMVMAQICLLLDQPEAAVTRPDDLSTIDPRLGVPLCLREFERSEGCVSELKVLREAHSADIGPKDFHLLVERWLKEPEAINAESGTFRSLVLAMPRALRPMVVTLAIENTSFSRKDWITVKAWAPARFSQSLGYRMTFAGVVLSLVAGLAMGLGRITGWWPAWGPLWLGWVTVAVVAGSLWPPMIAQMAGSAGEVKWGLRGAFDLVRSISKGAVEPKDFAYGAFGVALPFSMFLMVANGQRAVGWWAAAGVAAVAVTGAVAIWRVGRSRDNLMFTEMTTLRPFLRGENIPQQAIIR